MDAPVLKAFEDFLLRGNVVDLAVTVVIDAAFTAVVVYLVVILPMKTIIAGADTTGRF